MPPYQLSSVRTASRHRRQAYAKRRSAPSQRAPRLRHGSRRRRPAGSPKRRRPKRQHRSAHRVPTTNAYPKMLLCKALSTNSGSAWGDRVATERLVAAGVRSAPAHASFEVLPRGLQQADRCDGRAEKHGCALDDCGQTRVGIAFQQARMPQRAHPLRLVLRQWRSRHDRASDRSLDGRPCPSDWWPSARRVPVMKRNGLTGSLELSSIL